MSKQLKIDFASYWIAKIIERTYESDKKVKQVYKPMIRVSELTGVNKIFKVRDDKRQPQPCRAA